MNVLLVTAHYLPSFGYQEVYLAKALAKSGVCVEVITTFAVPPTLRSAVRGNISKDDACDARISVTRITNTTTIGAVSISRRLDASVPGNEYDVIIVVGPGKLFGLELLKESFAPRAVKIVLFGDNKDYFAWRGIAQLMRVMRMRLVRATLKKWAYRKAVARADIVIGYTPETRDEVKLCVGDAFWSKHKVHLKYQFLSLGYNEESFYCDPEARRGWREKHRIADNTVVLLIATRFAPEKVSLSDLQAYSSYLECNAGVMLILAGLDDSEYCHRIRDMFKAQSSKSRSILLPMQSAEELRAIYNAADVGVWMRPAITIQEAMSTGLYVVLAEKPSLRHLLDDSRAGRFTKSHAATVEWLQRDIYEASVNDWNEHRLYRAERSRTLFSSTALAGNIMELAHVSSTRNSTAELQYP